MKKRILSLLIAVLCILPLTLTGCSGDDEEITTGTTIKPLTLTLYGITDESTTAEAIQLVQDELNQFTEGTFNTHIILRLYPEDEYYAILDKTFNDLKYKDLTEEAPETSVDESESAVETTTPPATSASDETTEAPEYEFGTYPAEDGVQLDIFMVQGAAMLRKYKDAGVLASLNDALSNSSKLIKDYVSARLLATANIGGTRLANGLVDKGTYCGIPNNTVFGEYTYLLVNKELASQYYYSDKDVDTLDELADYLSDAINHDDYITLYNLPDSPAATIGNTLIGGVPAADGNAFTRLDPANLLGNAAYVNYLKNVVAFKNAGYVTEGTDDALPVDDEGNAKKVAAAFLKGDASLPASYEEDYFVIPYAMPTADAETCPGTMFCVSTYTKDTNRCVEVIAALQTNASFRNTFQYGVEDVHYRYDEFTGLITTVGTDYVMDPVNTGNLFLLTPNTSMDEKTLALAADNWALAKQQYRDTVYGPYSVFDFVAVGEDNYETFSSWYAAQRKEDYNDKLKAAKDAHKEATGKKFSAKDELAFEKNYTFELAYAYAYVDEALAKVETMSAEILEKIMAYNPETDGEWQAFIDALSLELLSDSAMATLFDAEHPDSLISCYNAWYGVHGVK